MQPTPDKHVSLPVQSRSVYSSTRQPAWHYRPRRQGGRTRSTFQSSAAVPYPYKLSACNMNVPMFTIIRVQVFMLMRLCRGVVDVGKLFLFVALETGEHELINFNWI